MPAGNVAHGLVWSHFTGFLQYVLPGKIIVEIDPFIAIKWHCYNQDTKVETQMKNKRREPNWVKRTPTKIKSYVKEIWKLLYICRNFKFILPIRLFQKIWNN